MIIMIIIIISIISFLLILWMQLPYIKNENPKENTYKYIYDMAKIPIIVVCLLLFIYNINSCISPGKKILDIDLSLPNF